MNYDKEPNRYTRITDIYIKILFTFHAFEKTKKQKGKNACNTAYAEIYLSNT